MLPSIKLGYWEKFNCKIAKRDILKLTCDILFKNEFRVLSMKSFSTFRNNSLTNPVPNVSIPLTAECTKTRTVVALVLLNKQLKKESEFQKLHQNLQLGGKIWIQMRKMKSKRKGKKWTIPTSRGENCTKLNLRRRRQARQCSKASYYFYFTVKSKNFFLGKLLILDKCPQAILLKFLNHVNFFKSALKIDRSLCPTFTL